MRDDEGLKCVAAIMSAYPKPGLTDDGAIMFARMLGDLDFAECLAAIERHICSSKWQPSIAEIREEVRKASATPIPAPEIAWGEVQKAIGAVGMNETPVFSCPEIAAAVDVVGWRTICLDENVTATRANFREAYRSFHDGTVRHQVLGSRLPVRGLPGQENMRKLGEVIADQARLPPAPAEAPEKRPARDPNDPTLSPWAKSLLEKYGDKVED